MRVWQILVPAGVIVALLLGVAFGQDEPARRGPLPTFGSLDDAAAAVPFELRLPKDLPTSLDFVSAENYLPPGRSNLPQPGDILTLTYFDEGTEIYLELMQSPSPMSVAGASEPVRVQGVAGQMVRPNEDRTPGQVNIQWTKDSMHFVARSTLTAEWTVDDLLAVLDSVQ